MGKIRRKFTREFKISVLREFDTGKTVAQVCREHDIHPTMLSKWKREYTENPETAFSGHGNIYKLDAKVAEYERMIGRLYSENEFLKKVLSSLEIRLLELRKREWQRLCT